MIEAQLKKGVLEMCVLYCIRDQSLYGYDVMKLIKRHFPEVNESTVYAVLRRLHADGSAQVSLGDTSLGPTRKYYQITDRGRDILGQSIAGWQRICGAVQDIGIE